MNDVNTKPYMRNVELEEKLKKEFAWYLPEQDVMVLLVVDFTSNDCFFDMAYEDLLSMSEGTGELGLIGEEMIYLGEI